MAETPNKKRLLVVANEPPWPANHGGRVDQWARYSGLRSLGWELALLTWSTAGAEPTKVELAHMETVFSPTIVVPKPAGLRGIFARLAGLPARSTHVSARLLSGATMSRVKSEVRAFAPAAVMVDAIYGFPAGKAIATELGIPIFLRSHNIEHEYMPMQSRAAVETSKKIQLALASWRLKPFEQRVHREVDWTFDISHDDLAFWRAFGISRNSWAPPFFPSLSSGIEGQEAVVPEYDLVYLGNLYTPNNVEGIQWLFEDVLKRVREAGVTPSVLIAGSNPADVVKELAGKYPLATLIVNPPNAREIRKKGRVLVNPILHGSGINIKSVEMLFEDAAVVTTSVGVQGMPSELRGAFFVSDTAEDFAVSILSALKRPYQPDCIRREAREVFGREGLTRFANELEAAIGVSEARTCL